MKASKSIKKTVCMLLCAGLAAGAVSGCGKQEAADGETVTIDFLSLWQGDSVMEPSDPQNNAVMNRIAEKTGVKINLMYNNVSEVERMNVMFASGDMPDLISAPMWGMDDACTTVLKKAAKEGLIAPLNELLDEYGENIKPSLSEGLTKDFIKYDLEDEEFGGEHYFIPACVTPMEERMNVSYEGLFMREDIYNAIGFDPESFKTSEDLYNVMTKIKAGGFKDANGKDIIVGGLLHNSNGLGQYTKEFTDAEGGFTGLYIDDEGHVKDDLYNPLLDEQILFVRKLVSEGLMDIEGFSQTSARAQEKIATGKYALVPGKYTDIYNYCSNTLYKTNPEMKYVALPPLYNANGNNNIYSLNGTGGCNVLFISGESKKQEAVIKVLNYLFSEEGYLLVKYGIEGENYRMNDEGKPEFIGESKEMYDTDSSKLYSIGIGSYNRLTGLQHSKTYGITDISEDQKKAGEVFTTDYTVKDGIRISYFELDYPDIDNIKSVKTSSKINEVKLKSYCAESDEQALGYINELRNLVTSAGIEKLWEHVEEKMAESPKTEYLY